jgi:hypothetical protein
MSNKQKDKESKVDFVVAGMQKGGTQALNYFLSQHPEVGIVSSPKVAPHFFDIEEYFESEPDYKLYHSWFSPESLALLTGDITPIYTYWSPCVTRIKTYNPKMKVIVLLRNPVDRAYSHWNMEYSRDNEHRHFLAAILMEPFRRGVSLQHPVYSYIHRGFYSKQIENLLDHFPRDQCLFVKNEDLRDDHVGTMRDICHFLGVNITSLPAKESVHTGTYNSPMNPTLRRLLTLLYWRDIKRLERLVGEDLSAWLRLI